MARALSPFRAHEPRSKPDPICAHNNGPIPAFGDTRVHPASEAL